MPDFNKIIAKAADKRAEIQDKEQNDKYKEGQENASADLSFDGMHQQAVEKEKELAKQQNPPAPDPRKEQYDLSQTSSVANDVSAEEQGTKDNLQQEYGGNENMYQTPQERGQWNPNEVYQDFVSKAGDNVMVGLGNMIGDWGNIAQFVGAALPGIDMYQGNMLSRAMQRVGGEISQANQTYISEDMRSPDFKFSTFINPEFWSVHGAQFVPQLLEILATEGIANAAERGVESAAKGILKNTLADAEKIAEKGLRTTTNSLRNGIVEVGRAQSPLGLFITDTGALTNLGSAVTKGLTGGLVTNLRVSLADAGEVYNTYKNMKDEQGNDRFTKEELGDMAAATFGNNMQYLLADIASWGMTFGGGWEQLGKSIGSPLSSLYNNVAQRKVIGGMFTKAVAPALKNLAKWGGEAVAEGIEETIQETFENWSKFKAYKEKAGTWKGFQGVTQDYDNYWDFYNSKDNESTKAVSFGLGAAAGGIFNMKQLVNKQADASYKLFDRTEALKQVIGAGNKGREMQDRHIREQMAELVFEGKEYAFGDFIGQLQERGVVDDQQFKKYDELFTNMKAVKNDVDGLNIKGKYAFMLNVSRQQDIDSKIQIEQGKYAQNLEVLESQLGKDTPEFQEAKKIEDNKFKEQMGILAHISEQLNDNKVKLLTGRPAVKVDYDMEPDENGNPAYVIKNEKATNITNEDGIEGKPNIPAKTILGRLSEKAKAIMADVTKLMNGDGQTTEDAGKTLNDQVPAETETEVTALDQLKQPLAPGETLHINDQPVEEFKMTSKEDKGDIPGDLIYKLKQPVGDNIDYNLPENAAKLRGGLVTNPEGVITQANSLEHAKITIKKKPLGTQEELLKIVNEEKAKQPYSDNPKVIQDPETKDIKTDNFKAFTDKGEIESGVLDAITEKVFEGKKLNSREVAVHKEFSKEIEANLKTKQETEQKANENVGAEENISENEATYVKKAIARKGKTKSISEQEIDYAESLKGKKVKPSLKPSDDIFDDINQNGKARFEGNPLEKAKAAVSSAINQSNFFSNIKSKFANLSENFENFKKEELGDKARTAFDNLINFSDDYDTDSLRFSQTVVVNERLKLQFPEAGVHVTEVNNLREIIGQPAMGYTLAGAMYIDSSRWDQDITFMHELSHVYYQLAPNDPYVNTIVSHALRNKDLVKQVLADYNSQLYYQFTNSKGDTIKVRKEAIGRNLLGKGSAMDGIDHLGQLDAAINLMVKSGDLVEIPLEEQPIIREELFAFTVEGPLTDNYDKFFTPKDEPVRKHLVKGFWKKVKERAQNADNAYNSDKAYFQTLSPDEKLEYNNAKDFVLTQIKEGVAGKDLSPVGRARYEEQDAIKTNEELKDIRERLAQQTESYFSNDQLSPEVSAERMAKGLDAMLEVEEYSGDDSNFFEADRIKYVQKASKIISQFASLYNKVRNRRFFNANKDTAVDWSKIPYFDADKLQIALFSLAKNSYSNEDFINRIENSDVEELFEFNKFLDDVRPDDKLLALSSMKFIFGNQSNINSVVGYVSPDGSFTLENNLSMKEAAQVENIQQQLYGSAANYFTSKAGADKYVNFIGTVEKIKSGNYDQHDLYDFLKMFSNSGIDIKSIMEENRINVNGKNFTVDTVVNEVIKNVFTPKSKNDSAQSTYSIIEADKSLKPVLRTFIKSLVSTNRKFTADYTVQNAIGNQEPIRVIDNFMTRELERIEHSALSMPRSSFLKKFANITSEGAGAKSNGLLNYMYDQINSGNKIDLNQYHGVKNQNTGQNTTIKDSSSSEQSVFELLTYLSADKKDSYMMETGRYSDSPTSYMLRVPRIDWDKNSAFVNGEFQFTANGKATVQNVFKTYQKLGGVKDLKAFENMVRNEINEEIKFTESNIEALSKLKQTKGLFDAKGKLTTEGKSKVAGYVANQIFNGINFSEIFFPSFGISDLSKRSKSGRSPGFRFGAHVKVEPVYFVDDMVNGNSVSDSGAYVLEEDANLIQKAGGNLMPLNKSYKLLNTGVEHDNPNFQRKNIFDKGYFTVLNDAFVKQNPRLKGLYDLMRQRRATYVDTHGPISNDLLNGIPTQFLYAAPISSNKSGNLPQDFVNEKDEPTQTGSLFTLDNLNDSTFEEQNKLLDSWYYDKKTGSFMGLSGDNFVVQQIMDKESYDVNTSIQMVRSILTNSEVKGSKQLAEEIQQLIVGEQQKVLGEFRTVMNSNDAGLIREFIKEHIDLANVDPLQRFLIVNDSMSMNIPALRELAKNTLSNAIRIAGNKLRTPGALAQAKAATYEKAYSTNGSKNLEFYGKRADGGHTMGEAVVPKFMSRQNGKKGKLTAREYIVQDSKADVNRPIALLESEAKNKAAKRGVKYQEVYNDKGVHIGYYVEGDSIIATRIPSHGPQTTGVFEVVDFDTTDGANIQLPSEFALNITGGDYDGDQFFIQHKGGKEFEGWNKAFDKLTNHWLSPEMANEVTLPIDFKKETETAIDQVEKVYGKKENETMYFSPKGRRENFNNTLISKGNIGVSANLHSLLGMLSAYTTPLMHPITINGIKSDVFQDSATESRTINSAKIFNIILDNAKMHYADKLGINEYTISHAMILRNLGYSLGDIGIILNSEPVQRINQILSNNDSIYTDKKSIADVVEMARSEMKLRKPTKQNSDVNTSKLNTDEGKNAVLDLMANLSSINEEIMGISTIMQGHNSLENNPFILKQQIDKFNDILNNEKNKGITVPAEFKQNPLVQNYLNVFDFNMDVQKQLDPVQTKVGIDTFEKVTVGATKTLSNQQIKKLHNDIEAFQTSRLLGTNNIGLEEMQSISNAAMTDITAHINKLREHIVKEDKNDLRLSISAYDNSLLFNKALRVSSAGNNQFISLNNNYFNANLSLDERKRVLSEFSELPQNLKNALVVYDLINNNWKGPKSLFHLFGEDFKTMVSHASDGMLLSKNETAVSPAVETLLTRRLIQTNSEMFTEREYPFDNAGNITDTFLSNPKNKYVLTQLIKNQPVIFRYKDNAGKMNVFQFDGWNTKQKADVIAMRDKANVIPFIREEIKNSRYVTYPASVYKNSIGVVSIPDASTGDIAKYDISDMAADDDSVVSGMSRREIASDYYNYTHTLSKDELMNTLGIHNSEQVSALRQDDIYAKYVENKKAADALSDKINTETVKKFSDEKLTDLYSGKNGLGHKDKIAYANVIRPVIMEIAARAGVEQQRHFNSPGYQGKDMGFFESYLVANNIPANQPEIQAMVRKMETEYRVFKREKAKYVSQINTVTEALYKEQFGYNPNSKTPMNFLKNVYSNLFGNQKDMYMKLYGPLIDFQEVTDSYGRKIMNMKYKSENEIQDGLLDKSISPAQYEFYKVTHGITEYLKPFALNGAESREDYIPHTAPAWLEIKARRGMLGLAVNSKTADERIYDVTMEFNNPITGKKELDVPFSHIENVYNTLSKGPNSIKEATVFADLKRKAIRLANRGINENGTPIRISNVEAGSAIGDVFMSRFSSSRSIAATDLPSLDLNKAFSDYTHSVLFNNGNENFAGMNKMLPLVDGILATADARGDENAKAYVDKVWKQYFLSGKKQDSGLPNSSSLAAVGITTDKVIDFLTKASLVYWLGWKGLVLTHGVYAVGNVLIGKYSNIKSGRSNWVRGESRFWGGINGFNLADPFKGVREANAILKTAGFSDINVYDNVNMQEKNSIEKSLMSIALFPMTWSERWIQGVDFLGRLTPQEWETLKEGKHLPDARMDELENDVKNNHGKGYSQTDQRMIQMYSWGRNFLQFSRYIPTLFYDQFAKEDINIYGKKHMGTYTAVGKTIQKGIRGDWTPGKFFEYRRGLDEYERKRLDQGLMGFGMIATMWGLDFVGHKAGESGFFADANPLLNADKMQSKLVPRSALMVENMVK